MIDPLLGSRRGREGWPKCSGVWEWRPRLYWGPPKFGFGGVLSCGTYQLACFGEEVLSVACRTQAEFSLKKPFSPIEVCVILSRQW